MNMGDIEYHKVNEEFSAVVLANIKLINLNPTLYNINSGPRTPGWCLKNSDVNQPDKRAENEGMAGDNRRATRHNEE